MPLGFSRRYNATVKLKGAISIFNDLVEIE